MLTETDNGSVLPSSQHIEPNTKTLFKRTLNAMMPGIKTRRAPAGDRAYGAGASSGGKAREPRRKTEAHIPLPALPSLTNIPPTKYPPFIPAPPPQFMLATPYTFPAYTYTATPYSTSYVPTPYSTTYAPTSYSTSHPEHP
ncbi:hypothetical protein B0H14DRAFT_3539626 [Mycena olivaceomarginata]|nr:hypothetical protein B0H14DRAFT_3539626 [Mycena olivaceomarginata]